MDATIELLVRSLNEDSIAENIGIGAAPELIVESFEFLNFGIEIFAFVWCDASNKITTSVHRVRVRVQ